MDEIILERDLPFLSSRLIVFFDTKREEGTLEPVVRERERKSVVRFATRRGGFLWWWW